MRDGVELLADHYEPITDNPAGTLLVRCPYGRRFPFTALYAGVYASRGYHVVFQSVRGTFGSGGEFNPMVDEIADGADTVEWLRPAVVHRFVRHDRSVVSGLHPVGAAGRSTAGDEGRRHHGGPT